MSVATLCNSLMSWSVLLLVHVFPHYHCCSSHCGESLEGISVGIVIGEITVPTAQKLSFPEPPVGSSCQCDQLVEIHREYNAEKNNL